MKVQTLFSGKYKKNVISLCLDSAELSLSASCCHSEPVFRTVFSLHCYIHTKINRGL